MTISLHSHLFASLALSRENNAIKVPEDAPLELLGPLGCGIQTGAGAAINALKVTPASSFVALGAGAVGLSALLAQDLWRNDYYCCRCCAISSGTR